MADFNIFSQRTVDAVGRFWVLVAITCGIILCITFTGFIVGKAFGFDGASETRGAKKALYSAHERIADDPDMDPVCSLKAMRIISDQIEDTNHDR